MSRTKVFLVRLFYMLFLGRGYVMTYDVAIIGAGVIGSMIARELSQLNCSVCVIEKQEDVATGTSRANSGIVHAGYDAEPDSLKAKFNVQGNAMMQKVAEELAVPYKNCGSIVVAFGKEDEKMLLMLKQRGEENGVTTTIINKQELKELEPLISEDITAALYAQTAGIVCPFRLTLAASENAISNGVKFYFDSKVTAIERTGGIYNITAGAKEIKAKYLVNAAGVFADEISNMAEGEEFKIRPRKGEYIIFDKDMSAYANTVIFRAPTKMGKGVLFAPTVYGNMLAGPTAEDIDDKQDKATTSQGLDYVLNGAKEYVPTVDRRSAITVFAGLRAVSPTHDFIIGRSMQAENFINVAGIESPGLTAAPAIAVHIKELLVSMGLKDEKNPDATRIRKPIEIFADATKQRQKELIEKDPRYANIVCRCEYVTEAEIIESIRRGARTVDGVKFRVSAGMGRCHGGFCMPRVMDILARELGCDYSEITKGGKGSKVLTGRTKEEQQ